MILDGDILQGAEEAFNETRYVEAFALLHAFIDWWMTALYQMREENKGNSSDELHFKQEYRYRSNIKYLRKEQVIDQKERNRLLAFDKLRNKIVHRLVMYGYQPYERNRITKDEVIGGFTEGKALVKIISDKTLNMV